MKNKQKQLKIKEKKQDVALKNLKNHKKQLLNINYYGDKLLISKETEIFRNIYNKRPDKIEELTKTN